MIVAKIPATLPSSASAVQRRACVAEGAYDCPRHQLIISRMRKYLDSVCTCQASCWCARILKGRLDGLLQPACALPLMRELLLGHAGCQVSLLQLLHMHQSLSVRTDDKPLCGWVSEDSNVWMQLSELVVLKENCSESGTPSPNGAGESGAVCVDRGGCLAQLGCRRMRHPHV